MTSPISGFGETNIYFVDFGIKTAKDGSYVCDQTTFNRTFTNTPEKFDALADDKVSTSSTKTDAVSMSDSGIPPGKYFYRQTDRKIVSYETSQPIGLMATSGSSPSFTISNTTEFPGFLITSELENPPNFDIYVGHSAKTKLTNFFTLFPSPTIISVLALPISITNFLVMLECFFTAGECITPA